jgi:hypothetical protein
MSEEIAPAQPSQAVALLEPSERLRRLFGTDAEVVISFDPRTEEGAELLFKCTLDKLKPLSEMQKEYVNVKHIFAHPAERIDPENGEVSQFVRSVVIDANGTAYDCGSEGVRKCIALLRAVRNDPPWNPPIRCQVIVQKTRTGRNWMILRPDAAEIFKNVVRPTIPPKAGSKDGNSSGQGGKPGS